MSLRENTGNQHTESKGIILNETTKQMVFERIENFMFELLLRIYCMEI